MAVQAGVELTLDDGRVAMIGSWYTFDPFPGAPVTVDWDAAVPGRIHVVDQQGGQWIGESFSPNGRSTHFIRRAPLMERPS